MTPKFWRDFVGTLLCALVVALACYGVHALANDHAHALERAAQLDTLRSQSARLDSAYKADSVLGAWMRVDSVDYAAERAALLARVAAYARLSAAPQRVAARTGGESVEEDVPTHPPNTVTDSGGSVTASEPSITARTLDTLPLSVEALSAIPISVLAPFAVKADNAARSCYAAHTSCELRADSAEAMARRATNALAQQQRSARRSTALRVLEDVGVFLLGHWTARRM